MATPPTLPPPPNVEIPEPPEVWPVFEYDPDQEIVDIFDGSAVLPQRGDNAPTE